jgi:hypothetical protein
MSWANSFINPQSTIVLKSVSDILPTKWPEHEEIIQRICHNLTSQKDLERLFKLFVDLYGAGFEKAIEENKAALNKIGIYPIIGTKSSEAENTIFKK